MRMSRSQFSILETDVLGTLREFDIEPTTITTMRDAWDALAEADRCHGTFNALFREGLNDNHIETALRQLFNISR